MTILEASLKEKCSSQKHYLYFKKKTCAFQRFPVPERLIRLTYIHKKLAKMKKKTEGRRLSLSYFSMSVTKGEYTHYH